MVRIFTVERGLFVGGWGDHDTVRAVDVREHSDVNLADIAKDAPHFFGRQSRRVCRVESTITGGSFITQQKRTLECVSGGSPPARPGMYFQVVQKNATEEPRVSHATLTFDNGDLPIFKMPGCAPHNYTIGEAQDRFHARRTKSLLCSEQWMLHQHPGSGGDSTSWTWVDGQHMKNSEGKRERDRATDSWVLFGILDPLGEVAAKVWMLPVIDATVTASRLGSGYYAIEMCAGDSYGARTEATLLPRALLFALAALHSYEYDKRTWMVGM